MLLAVTAVVVLALDQVTKALALAALEPGERVALLGDLLGLRLVYNPGAALGLASGMTWLLTVVAVGVVIAIIRMSRKLASTAWALALGLLLGGALGNLTDRLLRAPGFPEGHVVDFIDYWTWFVGNVADIAVVAAAVLIALLAFRGIGVDGTRDAGRRQQADTHDADHGQDRVPGEGAGPVPDEAADPVPEQDADLVAEPGVDRTRSADA